MDIEKIRQDFPILEKTGIKYFDSAATSLTPKQVVDAMNEYYNEYNANIHRGLHSMSQRASQEYEVAHEKVRKFINAKSEKEIILYNNTTEAVNQVANGLKFKKGQNIVTTETEHHSNFLPWLRLKKQNIEVRLADVNNEGMIDLDDLNKKVDKNTRLVALSGASNVLGRKLPVKEMCKTAHDNGSLVLIDGAQLVPHHKIDVRKLDMDFLAFSGHKMLGPTGTGILYAKEKLLKDLEPLNLGGGTIQDVTCEDYTLTSSPDKYEAGTPNIAGMIGLGAAVDYLSDLGMENVEKHGRKLTAKMLKGFEGMDKIDIIGPKNADEKFGVIAFNVKGMEGHDVALILDEHKFALRSGHHCTMPLHKKLNVVGSVRASFYIYNTEKEIDEFFDVMKEIVKLAK